MFGRSKSKKNRKSSKASKGDVPENSDAQGKGTVSNKEIKFERTVQAKRGEKIWVSIKKEEDYSYLWQLFEVASLSSDKKKVFVSDQVSGSITEVTAEETLSFDPCHEENFADLTRMNYLHEASLLYSLNKRYMKDSIYTWFGDTLISINPYFDVPDLYSGEVDPEVPHVFSVAARSYNLLKQKRRSQSIVINGDSGAGKTEAAKQMMRHLVHLASSKSETPQIEELVLSSTPVLEAFGNSITLRNDNSSRFGRFIQILFSDDGQSITGMNTKHFLLEKSRIISRSPGERNYHIFYQVASVDAEKLGFHSPDDYHYLQPVLNADNYRGVKPDDQSNFVLTENALQNIGIESDVREQIWKILLAILSLGNIDFIPDENDTNNTGKCKMTEDSAEYLKKVCEMLNIEIDSLEKSLVMRTMETKTEVTEIALTVEQASDSRDALAKFLYSTLFDWLIMELNRQSALKAQGGKVKGNSRKKEKFIGILDIFGFEDLENNSFEQICVNYANELLQHEFDKHIIASERKLFLEEGVEFPDIELPSIIAAEEVLSTLTNVVFAKLEEQCLLKSGSDKSFLGNLSSKDVKSSKLRMDWKASTNFVVSHFAGEVSYNTEGFLAKNRDSLVNDLRQAIYVTDNGILVQHLGLEKLVKTKNLKMANKETVLKGFQADMKNLVSTITSSDTRFVRCIKPNHAQNEKDWDVQLILSQLDYLGINQAIRVHDETYPVRRPFSFIPEKYLFLFDNLGVTYIPGNNDREVMRAILLQALGTDSEFKLWQCGNTKVFLGNQVLFQLDALINEKRQAELAAMTEVEREKEMEKERQRQREELKQAKLKMERDKEAILKQQQERFEEKEKIYKMQLAQKDERLQKELKRAKGNLEEEFNEREASLRKQLERDFKAREEQIHAAHEEKVRVLELRNKELEEGGQNKERELKRREREVEERYQEARKIQAKQELAMEHAKQSSALSKEQAEQAKNKYLEQIRELQEKEASLEARLKEATKSSHTNELSYQEKYFALQLELQKMKSKEEVFGMEKERFEKEKSRILRLEKKLQENEKAREARQAEKLIEQAQKRREKDARRYRKMKLKGAILMQKLVRGYIIRRNYLDMLARSRHFDSILEEAEKVIFSSVVLNVKPVSKGSKSKRRALVLTSKKRMMVVDPLTFRIDQRALYDPKLCKATATGEQGKLHIYFKSDWLATEKSEWVLKDILNESLTWVGILTSLTDFSNYVKHGFFNCLRSKRVKRKDVFLPLKFGQMRMTDDNGEYDAGDDIKTKKGKVIGGVYFMLFRRKEKHFISWFPDEKAESPGGKSLVLDRNSKVIVPDQGAVNGKFALFMFCLLIRRKKKNENIVSFDTKGVMERDAWVRVLRVIIKREKFKKHDIEKVKKQLKEKARSSQNVRASIESVNDRSSRNSRNRDSGIASGTLRDEPISHLLQIDETRPSYMSSNKTRGKKGRTSMKGRKSNRPFSNLERIPSRKSNNGRSSKRGISITRIGSKKKSKSTFKANDFLTSFEDADRKSYASMNALKKG